MRPLRLTVEAFTCFKDRQPPLDLSGLELFAIAGPTGAGKSSLLDAIIFALYGRVPRMRRGYSELISLGRDRMSVTLDFRIGERDFRIVRVARRGRSAEAQLDELSGGGERSLAGGVQGVDNQIGRLLGLRYEAFTQAVVLPQGDFARFLKSQPRERREILRDLLRLQVYEHMRRAAAESSRELELRLGGVRERLNEDYAEVEPRQLADLERSLKTIGKDHVRMTADLTALQKRVEEKRSALEKTQELSGKKSQLDDLAKAQSAVEAMEKELAAARKVTPLLPLMEAAVSAEQRSQEDRRRAQEAASAHGDLRASHEEAVARLRTARQEAEELPRLTLRIRALDELKGFLEPRDAAMRRRDEARGRVGGLERELESASRESQGAREALANLQRDLEAVSTRLDGLGYDAVRERRLDAVRDRASALVALRQAATEAESEATETKERASREQRIVSEREALVGKVRMSLESCARAREKIESERERAEKAHAVAHLRRQLEPGGACPVCGQKVAKLPRSGKVASPDALGRRLQEARDAEDSARASLEKELASEAAVNSV